MKRYFEAQKHGKGTRNQNFLIKLPRVKLELGKHTYSYSGAKLYNEQPLSLRSRNDFKNLLRSHHSQPAFNFIKLIIKLLLKRLISMYN